MGQKKIELHPLHTFYRVNDKNKLTNKLRINTKFYFKQFFYVELFYAVIFIDSPVIQLNLDNLSFF